MDSGNLAASLLTLRPGLLAVADDKILGARLFAGLRDTLEGLQEAAGGTATTQLAQLQNELARLRESPPVTLTAARLNLEGLMSLAAKVADALEPGSDGEASWWASAFAGQCRAAGDELTFLAPWSALLTTDGCSDCPELSHIPTLRELATLEADLLTTIEQRHGPEATPEPSARLAELRPLITQAGQRARARISTIATLAQQCEELARFEYDFLFDKARDLLAIGYNVGDQRLDAQLLRSAGVGGASGELRRRSPRASCRRSTGSRWADCSPSTGRSADAA